MVNTSDSLNSPQTTIDRGNIIQNKYFLKNIYTDFYSRFKKLSLNLPRGKKLEIGSGAGFIKELIPDVITSDIMKLPKCDLIFSAEQIPFDNNSLSAIYMLNTFHHIKNPKKAIKEFSRSLKRGGKVIMIEPYNSVWGRFIYKNFHHEKFDPSSSWKINGKGNLSDANGALPWIVFVRDEQQLKKLFPELKIIKINPHTPFRYLLSGGFTKPQLLPNFLYKPLVLIENIIRPLDEHLGIFVTIVLKKY